MAIWMMIFLLKVCELTLESLRLLLMVDGYVVIASVISTIDVLLALVALKYIVENLKTKSLYVAYALGYGVGVYLGSLLFSLFGG
jgi:uncharacterized protein YebE (UPF0316 family)